MNACSRLRRVRPALHGDELQHLRRLDDAFELDLLAVVAGEATALVRAFLDAAHDTAGESELGPATRA